MGSRGRLRQITRGRGNYGQIYGNLEACADAANAFFLNRFEQLGLQIETKLADFVRKNRAASDFTMTPLFLSDSGESLFFISEKLGADEFRPERRAVETDKLFFSVRALILDPTGKHRFSRPPLALQQNVVTSAYRSILAICPVIFEFLTFIQGVRAKKFPEFCIELVLKNWAFKIITCPPDIPSKNVPLPYPSSSNPAKP